LLRAAVIVLWPAAVNTACVFLLYNHALLAWRFLDERLGLIQIAGMVVLIAGVTLVQRNGSASSTA